MRGRGQNVAPHQLDLLLKYMEVHKEFAQGQMNRVLQDEKKALMDKWDALAKVLNAAKPGATRSGRKWRIYWNEQKYSTRRRARARLHGNGGVPVLWTTTDDRIMNILGKDANLVKDSPQFVQKPENDGLKQEPVLKELQSTPKGIALDSVMVTSCPSSPSSPDQTEHLYPEVQYETTSPPPVATHRPVMSPDPLIEPPTPQWVLDFEERRVSAEERRVEQERIAGERWEEFKNTTMSLMERLVTALERRSDCQCHCKCSKQTRNNLERERCDVERKRSNIEQERNKLEQEMSNLEREPDDLERERNHTKQEGGDLDQDLKDLM